MCRQLFRRNAAQVESLAPRQNGHRDLSDFGRREDELHIVGRLFKCLQKRVEGALRHHVDFVDDVDLVSSGDGTVSDALDDLAGIVDAGMACRVDFQNIDMMSGGNRSAGVADPAWLQRGTAFAVAADTVEPPRQKPCRRGLADTADTGQHEGVGKAAKRQGVLKGADKRVLADQLGEAFRPVGAREDTIPCQDAVIHDA